MPDGPFMEIPAPMTPMCFPLKELPQFHPDKAMDLSPIYYTIGTDRKKLYVFLLIL
jgi:hypothetical protein